MKHSDFKDGKHTLVVPIDVPEGYEFERTLVSENNKGALVEYAFFWNGDRFKSFKLPYKVGQNLDPVVCDRCVNGGSCIFYNGLDFLGSVCSVDSNYNTCINRKPCPTCEGNHTLTPVVKSIEVKDNNLIVELEA
jgi:hypothetical protein